CGLISPESATDDYGVVLTKAGRKWQPDLAKTAQRRRQLASLRGKVPMFDRGPHFAEQKRLGSVHYPEGWSDPDSGWLASGELKQDVARSEERRVGKSGELVVARNSKIESKEGDE